VKSSTEYANSKWGTHNSGKNFPPSCCADKSDCAQSATDYNKVYPDVSHLFVDQRGGRAHSIRYLPPIKS